MRFRNEGSEEQAGRGRRSRRAAALRKATRTKHPRRSSGASNESLLFYGPFDPMADDVIIEFPYGPSLGMPDGFVGKQA